MGAPRRLAVPAVIPALQRLVVLALPAHLRDAMLAVMAALMAVPQRLAMLAVMAAPQRLVTLVAPRHTALMAAALTLATLAERVDAASAKTAPQVAAEESAVEPVEVEENVAEANAAAMILLVNTLRHSNTTH